MLKLMPAAGYNVFVLAALGVALVWTAIRFARRADAQRLSVIRALTWALLCSAVVGFVSNLATVATTAADGPPEDRLTAVLIGFAESSVNVTLGLGIACITWVLVAVGLRRMPGEHS